MEEARMWWSRTLCKRAPNTEHEKIAFMMSDGKRILAIGMVLAWYGPGFRWGVTRVTRYGRKVGVMWEKGDVRQSTWGPRFRWVRKRRSLWDLISR